MDVLRSEPVLVFVDALADSAVTLGMRCYCENPKYWDLRWRLLENAKNALDETGIEIPYQQLSVHMEQPSTEKKNSPASVDINKQK